ncbi:MAG: TlpA family protein disulfide reductase [Clostridia bacterium]|nr:TlpA family protein disulfide reductase [Clostridia bacterium]
MKKNLKMIIIFVLAVLLIGGGTLLYRMLINKSALPETGDISSDIETEKAMFVPFEVTGSDGKKITLEHSSDKVTVINFWASWCTPCREEMDIFERLYLDHGDVFEIKMINLTDGQRETMDTAQEYITKKGYSFPVFFDEDYNGVNEYYVVSIPRTLIIDKDGTIIFSITGEVTEETFEKIISSYIK